MKISASQQHPVDKIIFLTDIPTYHKISLLNHLAQSLRASGLELQVTFLLPTEKRRQWNIPFDEFSFDYSILHEFRINLSYEWTLTMPFRLIRRLILQKPRAIITGGFSLSTLAVAIYSRCTGVPYLIWSGDYSLTSTSRSKWRKVFRRILVHFASAVITYGTKAAQYMAMLNNRKQVFVAFNTVDSIKIAERARELKASSVAPWTNDNRQSPVFNMLFVGGLVDRKGVSCLLDAFSRVQGAGPAMTLHIVGDGPQKKQFEELADSLGLSGKVVFWGHIENRELVAFYAKSDIFVFPTLGDIWGLVLNEAMAAGLPVIASKYAGASHDLVQEGWNGFIVDPRQTAELAKKIRILIENADLRKMMAARAQITVLANFTTEKTAQKFAEAVMFSLGQTPPSHPA